jgi:hypothetical protein
MWRRSRTHLSSGAAALALLALASGCGSKSTSHVLSVMGRIGTLRVDRSDRAAVIRFAGRPSAERVGHILNYAPYRALGYRCRATSTLRTVQLTPHGPYCRTAFFLERRTGKLEIFFTTAPEYSESHGVRIGMAQAAAERLVHQRLVVGCLTAMHFSSATASIKGAHVDAFLVHGHGDEPGIFDCL